MNNSVIIILLLFLAIGNICADDSLYIYVVDRHYVVDEHIDRLVRINDMTGTGWISYSGRNDDIIDVAIDTEGRIYLANFSNNSIFRINDMSGAGRINYGFYGSGVGEFGYPLSIAVDNDGKIYVGDRDNRRIVRIDDMIGSGWVSYGDAPTDSFVGISDIAIGPDGKIYSVWAPMSDCIYCMDDMTGEGWITYGTTGSGVGGFNSPIGITVDFEGRIYIADHNNHCIVRIDDMFGTGWVSYGTGPGDSVGEFNHPAEVAVGPEGKIYITDYFNARIVRIDDMTGAGWIEYGDTGSGIDEFHWPTGIAVVRSTLGITEEQSSKPQDISLSISPNPFNSSCRITTSLNSKIEIYNLNGKQIETFEETPAIWQPEDEIGSGIYLVRATTKDGLTETKRIIYLK